MTTTHQPLAGQVAVVTGAGKNIGRAIAHALAADGATIVVNGRSDQAAIDAVAAEIRDSGGEAMACLADVSDEAAVAEMIDTTVKRYGGVDIAVSNAGLRRQTPFQEMSFAEWREIMSVALDGAFLLSRQVVPHMMARGGGAIVGLSGVSHHIGMANRVHVNASKSGLEGFVRGLALELASHGIRVNAVSPGSIDTVRGAAAGALPGNMGAADIPLGRQGSVEEIADTVRFLVGPSGGYITGQTIHVNGGKFLGK